MIEIITLCCANKNGSLQRMYVGCSLLTLPVPGKQRQYSWKDVRKGVYYLPFAFFLHPRVGVQVAAYGLGDLDGLVLVTQGGYNFTFLLPLSVNITLPPISMTALGNLISIPGLTLETDGNLNVALVVTGGFNITGKCDGAIDGAIDTRIIYVLAGPFGLRPGIIIRLICT